MSLKKMRSKIDSIDKSIVNLLSERSKITLSIGKLKTKNGKSIFVPEREADVYRKIETNNKGPLDNDAVKAVFREIMSGSLKLEKNIEVAYLGPAYTYTHMASMKKFGSSVSYKSCKSITDVFVDVERGRSDYGVVPIENSFEGAVNHTLDMFVDSGLKICSEVFLEISHSLLSKESDMSKIKKVYSKAEVFGQCRQYLEANLPGVELMEAPSTANAADIASRQRGVGCIASELAARRYGLKIIARSVEDSSHNVTRFLVIGRTEAKPTKKDKTSLMISLKDRVGALHDMLTAFKNHKINLTKIESRPSKVRPWEYYFFIDLSGHHLDRKVDEALREVKKVSQYIKVLGSYPEGEKV